MPQSVDLFFNDAARQTRLRRGHSIRSLAKAADVSPNTVVRLERGLAVNTRSLLRIAEALDVTVDRLRPVPLGDSSAVHLGGKTSWSAIEDKRPDRARSLAEKPLSDCGERLRIGSVGLATGFLGVFHCGIEHGQLMPSIMELYGETEETHEHPGEEFVYCIEGQATVLLPDRELYLAQCDSAIFWSHQPHRYASINGPAKLIVVCRETKSGQL